MSKMKTCNTLFKTTCDACSKSKTKCDGGNPCEVCQTKNLECKYAFRMKRGPKAQSSDDKGQKRTAKAIPRVMSSFERRLWSVFFTIFKNTKASNADSRFSWCWYANQLNKLNAYFKKSGNERLISLLGQFYQSLDIEENELKQEVTKACPFSAHVCGKCTSMTILPPESEKLLPNANVTNTVTSEFQKEFTRNQKPCLVYFTGDSNEHGFSVNNVFEETFDYDAAELNKLLHWSNGGFLPFGGDLFSALFVYESDVLLYLQIMSFKYQAARLIRTDMQIKKKSWKIPSCHSFKCWCRLEPGSERVICDVYFHFLVILRQVDDTHLTTRMELVVHSISPCSEKPAKKIIPISHEFPLVEINTPSIKKPRFSDSASLVTDLLEEATEAREPVQPEAPLFSSSVGSYETDQLPEPILFHHNNWERFPDKTPLQSRSSTNLLERSSDNIVPEYGDGEWLETLFQWALGEDQDKK